MTLKRRKLIAGNWKMNETRESAVKLAQNIAQGLKETAVDADILVCPPFVYLDAVSSELNGIALGAQDCAATDNGAHTGDISAAMLRDMGCAYVIAGHSERRQNHKETDAQIATKAHKAIEAGLRVIICVGETLAEREAGQTTNVIARQLEGSVPANATAENIVIAYEPVWAIGTGLVATTQQIADVHAEIRNNLENRLAQVHVLRIIYGGSVKPENAADIFTLDDVDGALIGGASLKAESFLGIARAI